MEFIAGLRKPRRPFWMVVLPELDSFPHRCVSQRRNGTMEETVRGESGHLGALYNRVVSCFLCGTIGLVQFRINSRLQELGKILWGRESD